MAETSTHEIRSTSKISNAMSPASKKHETLSATEPLNSVGTEVVVEAAHRKDEVIDKGVATMA